MIVTLIIIVIVMVVINYASTFCVTFTPSLATDAVFAEGLPKSCS